LSASDEPELDLQLLDQIIMKRAGWRGEGAIDVPSVKTAITEIMEGGEAAFKLRRQKYGF
jgi:hypothetical protein